MVLVRGVAAVTTALRSGFLMMVIAAINRPAERGIVEVASWIADNAVLLRVSLTRAAFFAYDPDHSLGLTASMSDGRPRRRTGSWGVGTSERRLRGHRRSNLVLFITSYRWSYCVDWRPALTRAVSFLGMLGRGRAVR